MAYYGGLGIISSDSFGGLGRTVAGIGDINGDGIDDVLVSDSRYFGGDGNYIIGGTSYVIFGSADGTLPINISVNDLDGSNGFRVNAESPNGYFGGGIYGFGSSITQGDFNGDGVDDVFIGVYAAREGFEGPNNPGGDSTAGFILYGRDTAAAGNFEAQVVIGDGAGTEGVTIAGLPGAAQNVDTGDFNGDGVDDLLITVSNRLAYSVSETTGYVIFGGAGLPTTGEIDPTQVDGENGFSFDLGSADLSNAGGFYGEGGFGVLGQFQSGAVNLGDVDGDGFDDIGAGTVFAQSQNVQSTSPPTDPDIGFFENNGYYYFDYVEVDRTAYVLFGEASAAGDPATKDLETAGEEVVWDALSESGVYDNVFGFYNYGQGGVFAIGDVNGDGFDDVAYSLLDRDLSADLNPNETGDEEARGVVGIIYGGPDGIDRDGAGPQDGLNAELQLATPDEFGNLINEPDVLIVNSNDLNEGFGAVVTGLGDINGDGVDDFAISVPNDDADTGEPYYGEVFVVLGKDEEAGDDFPQILDLDNLSQTEIDGSVYRIIQDNIRFTDFGLSVAAAGDLNGDGFDDIILGAYRYGDQNSEVFNLSGKAFVVFGGADNLEAVDNADGANDNTLNVENLIVDALTGEVPILVSVSSSGFVQSRDEGDTGTATYQFTVQRTGDLTTDVSFDFDVSGTGFRPAMADDFAGGAFPSGSASFASGESTVVIDVEVQGDTAIEPNEDFFFSISNPTTSGTAPIGLGVTDSLGRIINDDFPATITMGSINADEDGQIIFTVFRSGDTTSNVSVDFEVDSAGFSPATADDIANVTADGVSLGGGLGQTGTLTFAPGETEKTITIDPVDDLQIEGTEFVEVNLSNLTGNGPVNLITTSRSAAIQDNDFPPQIFAGRDIFVTENSAGTLELEIIRRGDTTGEVEVTFDLNPVPLTGGFFAADSNDVDVILPTVGQTVRFEDGESVKTVAVTVSPDNTIEPREQFELRITDVESFNGVTYSVLDPNQIVTILNDDGRPPIIPIGVEADVFGDPHIITLDGLGYDFQAVGEYVLVESTIVDDPRDFQVQVRFEPLPDSDLVSVTTRMAVNVGDVIVEVDALGDDAILIDGRALTIEELAVGAVDVDGDGTFDVFFNEEFSEITVVLNDLNEQLKVANLSGVLNVCVFLSEEAGGHANNVIGLMGNANGDTSDDLTLRDGSITYTEPTFDELYVTYADSWRVTPAEREFTDPEGTGEFPDNFPAAKITIDDLPATVLAAATAAVDAAEITDPIIRESAILDFALTGDSNFIQGALGLAAEPVDEIDVTDAPDMPLIIGVSPSETSIVEGNSETATLIYTFWRIGDDSQEVVVDYAIGGDVDLNDLVPGTSLTGSVTIPAGTGSATLAVGVTGDLASELDEALVVSITGNNSGALVAAASGTTEVITDDFVPVAEDDQFATVADTVLIGDLLAANPFDADSDANGDMLTVTGVTDASGNTDGADGNLIILPSGAHLRVDEDGTFTYNAFGFTTGLAGADDTVFDQLGAGETGTDTFSYTISDGNGGADTADVTITVAGVDDAPLAIIDEYILTESETVSGNALTDTTGGTADFDPEGDPFEITQINGVDLDAIDEDGATDGTQITVGDGGQLTIFANGDFTFDTAGAYESLGDDPSVGQLIARLQSVTYTITDDTGLSNSAALRFSVRGENDAPDAMDDVGSTDAGVAVNIDVLANDTDAENDDLTVQSADSADGEVVIEADNTITFTPNAGFSGDASITYDVADAAGAVSSATVTVAVSAPANNAPVAEDDMFTVDEDAGGYLSFLENDNDADGDELQVTILSGPSNGTLVEDSEGYFYSPDPDYNGPDSFVYQVSDGNGGTDTATVNITVNAVNDDPVANDDAAATGFNTSVLIDVLDNDTDVDGDTLTIAAIEGTGPGGAFDIVDGQIEFTPNNQFVGETTFSYTVSDGMGGLDTADVTVTVGDPVARGISISDASVVEGDNGTTSMTFTLTRTQLEGADQVLSMVDNVVVTSSDGTAEAGSDYDAVAEVVTFASGEMTKTVTVTVLGDTDVEEDEFMFLNLADTAGNLGGLQLTDAQGQGTIANDDAEAVNTAPMAADDSGAGFGTDEDTAFTTGNVLGNDTDADADTVSVVALDSTGTLGLVTDNGDGTFDYDPNGAFEALNDGETATDSFTYTVSDGNGGLDTATVTIDIAGVTDAVALNPIAGTDAPFEQLTGTDAADAISTGGGVFDYLTGGGGADVFIIDHENGNGRQLANVLDYEVGVDAIDLQGRDVAIDYSFGNATYLILEGSDFDTVIVNGVSGIDQITFVDDVFIA